MSSSQKIVKGFALALACVIILSILGGACAIINGIIPTKDAELTSHIISSFENVDIDISAAELNIKEGNEFKVELNDKCKYEIKDNTLYIEFTDNYLGNKKYTINLYIPKGTSLKKFNLKGGAGKVYIERLEVENAYINVGAGKVEIDWLYAKEYLDFDGGAGDFVIKSGIVNRTDFDQGVGNTNVKVKILSTSKFDMGIGNLDLELMDGVDSYSFDVSKGIGNVTIDGVKVSEGTYGSGRTTIKVDGGIGNIKIH